MKYLAIDYGRKRIGLAVSYGSLAEPLRIVEHSDDIHQVIAQIVHDEQIDEIVVGLSDKEMAEETTHFANELKKYVDTPFHFFDESFSSKKVHQKMMETGASQHKRSQPIDHLAAAEFLQEFLDTNKISDN